MQNSKQIRSSFVNFFKKLDHKQIPSSSTIPYNDPTILFTNAGMNQFKGYFLGEEKPQHPRAVTVQKAIRAGGKHNDLDNVGYTARHHTFFEMLGNFSFGDYFKEQAIFYAWDWLTNELKIPESKLAVSVFENDTESYDLWHKKMGVPTDRIAKLGEKDNFWMMGDTGPCGPCSEIHFDLYPNKFRTTPKESLEKDDGRFLEIWNLVFMEFNRLENQTLVKLPNPNIDTGCGLERIASVMQGVFSNYDTDIFQPLLQHIAKHAKYHYGENANLDIACRVIADHIRACCFTLADGAVPSNEGRGYVVRRIIRRALRFANTLSLPPFYFAELSKVLIADFQVFYPELGESQVWINDQLIAEEKRFTSTLKSGVEKIQQLISANAHKPEKTLAGKEIFKLYDTYGFPLDLTEDILREQGWQFSKAELEAEMLAQREKARKDWSQKETNKAVKDVYLQAQKTLPSQQFVGYETLFSQTAAVALFQAEQHTDKVDLGQAFEVYLASTPFYATGGGQQGDSGWLEVGQYRFRVINSQQPLPNFRLISVHNPQYKGVSLSLADFANIYAKVDEKKRWAASKNHTATHLLHAALRSIFGVHVKQAGSLVDDSKLRFDFNHSQPITRDEMAQLEWFVEQQVMANHPVQTSVMTLNEALDFGALAFFGDKYSDLVRVVDAGPESKELCGGTHVHRTGDIGCFMILQEQGIAAGTRRIEALTGEKALEKMQANAALLGAVSNHFAVPQAQISEKVIELLQKNRRLQEELLDQKRENISLRIQWLLQKKESSKKAHEIAVAQNDPLDLFVEVCQKHYAEYAFLLYQPSSNNKMVYTIVLGSQVSADKTAKQTVAEICQVTNGKGGGQQYFARCSGSASELTAVRNIFYQAYGA